MYFMHCAKKTKGFLKIFDKNVQDLNKPQAGIKIETGLEHGYILFQETIISCPFYPTSLKSPY